MKQTMLSGGLLIFFGVLNVVSFRRKLQATPPGANTRGIRFVIGTGWAGIVLGSLMLILSVIDAVRSNHQ